MEINEITPDKQLLGCRWVYNLKQDENGKVIGYKAKLVAQGYSQAKGENYETFSPVNFSVISLIPFKIVDEWSNYLIGWRSRISVPFDHMIESRQEGGDFSATNRVPAPQHLPTNGVHITRPTEVNFSYNSEKFAAKTVPVTTPPCHLR
ncbi:hypothetical protein TNCV_3726611 [Trichonephila clavipes]|nr:hypothetical protein TNCV_3726611 [Trichonephila clavipes]